jgi:hypothetical protein
VKILPTAPLMEDVGGPGDAVKAGSNGKGADGAGAGAGDRRKQLLTMQSKLGGTEAGGESDGEGERRPGAAGRAGNGAAAAGRSAYAAGVGTLEGGDGDTAVVVIPSRSDDDGAPEEVVGRRYPAVVGGPGAVVTRASPLVLAGGGGVKVDGDGAATPTPGSTSSNPSDRATAGGGGGGGGSGNFLGRFSGMFVKPAGDGSGESDGAGRTPARGAPPPPARRASGGGVPLPPMGRRGTAGAAGETDGPAVEMTVTSAVVTDVAPGMVTTGTDPAVPTTVRPDDDSARSRGGTSGLSGRVTTGQSTGSGSAATPSAATATTASAASSGRRGGPRLVAPSAAMRADGAPAAGADSGGDAHPAPVAEGGSDDDDDVAAAGGSSAVSGGDE